MAPEGEVATATTGVVSKGRRNIFLVSVVADSLGSGLWMPFAVIFFTKAQGQSVAATGIAMTCGAFIGLLAGFASGYVVDRRGAGVVALFSHLMRVLSFAAYPFVDAPWQIVVVIAVTACGERMLWTANVPMISTIFKGRAIDNVLGLTGVLGIVGLGIGAAAAGFLADSVTGLRLIVWLNAVSFAITGVLLIIVFGRRILDRPRVEGTAEGLTGISTVWRDRDYLKLCLVQVLFVVAGSAYVIILPLVIIDEFGAATWVAAMSIVVGNVAIALATRPALALSATRPRGRMLLVAVGLFVVSLLFLVPGGSYPSQMVVPVVVVVVVLAGVAEAMSTPLMLSAANEAAPVGQKGRYSAVFQTGWGAAEMVGPLLYTTLLGVGNHVLWLALAAVVLCVAPLVLYLRSRLPETVLAAASKSDEP